MVQFIYSVPLYSSIPGDAPARFVLIKSLDPAPGGKGVLVHGFNEKTLSVDANGVWSWEPLGQADSTTIATPNGDTLLVFDPTSGAGQPFVYPVITSEV